jgi:hypothetical protein
VKQASKLLVYDSLHIWHIGTNELRAQFRWQWVGASQVILINQSSGTFNFQWDLGDGTTSTSGTFFHSFPAMGSYTVRLIAINGSCSDTCYGVVNLTNVGITEAMEKEPFMVTPNPSSGLMQIKADAGFQYDLCIINLNGQVIMEKHSISGASQIDISHFPSGVYFLRVHQKQEKTFYKRFVRE